MKRITTLIILFLTQIAYASKVDTLNFKVESEGYELSAQLIKQTETNEKQAAIIFLVGSGASASHRTNYRKFTHFFLAEKLIAEQTAMVYFDKRGVGPSEGNWYETSFEQRALDAKNVAIEVQKLDFIDSDRIYVVGHSQGGWIAQIAVAKYPNVFAGGISMAGATYGVKKQLISDYQTEMICEKGLKEEKALKKATKKMKRAMVFVNMFGSKGNLKQLKVIQDFEPAPYIRSIKKPFLLMFGEEDGLVNANWCQQELTKMFPKGFNEELETYLAQKENHSFKIADKCYNGKWSDIYYSEQSQQKIYSWFVQQYTN